MMLAGCSIGHHAVIHSMPNIVDCTCRLVLKGTYCGVAVAVCRVMPASSTIYKSIFGVSAKQDAAAMRSGRAGTGKGRPRRASASRGKSKDRTSPLLEAQVVTSKTYLFLLIRQEIRRLLQLFTVKIAKTKKFQKSCCFQAHWFTS